MQLFGVGSRLPKSVSSPRLAIPGVSSEVIIDQHIHCYSGVLLQLVRVCLGGDIPRYSFRDVLFGGETIISLFLGLQGWASDCVGHSVESSRYAFT